MKLLNIAGAALAASLAIPFAAESTAHAIPLPDNSSCSTASGAACLKINNTSASTGAFGIWGNASYGVVGSGTQIGVYATTSGSYALLGQNLGNGEGVFGSAGNISSAGVHGRNTVGNAVFGECSGTGASGVYGSNSTSSGFGVAGRVPSSSNGAAVFGDSGFSGSAWAGRFDGRVTASQYATNSDARLKTNIQDSRYGVETLGKLRAVTYKWKDPKHDQTPQVGLIAQEVQKVIPELVSTDSETKMLSVNYQGLVPVLVKSVQDQQQVIKQQEQRIAALEKLTARPVQANAALLTLGLLPLAAFAAWRRRKSA